MRNAQADHNARRQHKENAHSVLASMQTYVDLAQTALLEDAPSLAHAQRLANLAALLLVETARINSIDEHAARGAAYASVVEAVRREQRHRGTVIRLRGDSHTAL